MRPVRQTKENGVERIPPARRALYSAILLMVPVIALMFLEIVLRVTGYGDSAEFFKHFAASGREYRTLDGNVARRYFSALDVEPASSSDVFLVKKPEGSKRVFFLGASALLGYPYMYNASPSSIIRDALRRDHPGQTIEVVNLSMTAVTSHAVREFGIACLDQEPDLLVVYAGHNEYYGALGVASTESFGPPWMTRLYLELRDLRIVQVLSKVLSWIASPVRPEQEVSGTLMEALAGEKEIPFDSPRFAQGIEVFDDSMSELISAARRKGVPIVLSTVVGNLSGLRPFRSLFSPSLDIQEREMIVSTLEQWEKGGTSDGGNRSLREQLEVAYSSDSSYALSAFHLASVRSQQGSRKEAYRLFERAKDLDGLRFRAPAALNESIRRRDGDEGVTVVDVEQGFRIFSKDSIPGNDLMHEHVHMNVSGYEIVAGLLYPAIQTALGLTPSGTSGPERRLKATITPVDSVAAAMRLSILMNSWPFATTRRSLSDIRPVGWLEDLAHAFLRNDATWEQMHVKAAETYESQGLLDESAREYRALLAATPYNLSPYLRLADILVKSGERDQARVILEASREVEASSRALLQLGQLAYERGDYAEAASYVREALASGSVDPQAVKDVRLSLVVALERSGQADAARAELDRLRASFPDFVPAQELEKYLRR